MVTTCYIICKTTETECGSGEDKAFGKKNNEPLKDECKKLREERQKLIMELEMLKSTKSQFINQSNQEEMEDIYTQQSQFDNDLYSAGRYTEVSLLLKHNGKM